MASAAMVVSCETPESGKAGCVQVCIPREHVAAIVPELRAAPAEVAKVFKAESGKSLDTVLAVLQWFRETGADYLLWSFHAYVELTQRGLSRLVDTIRETRASIVYSDYFELNAEKVAKLHPLIDYQPGSLRDDFDFGELVLIEGTKATSLISKLQQESCATSYGGWYDLRLRLSESGPVVRLSEPTYTVVTDAAGDGGESHFSYVDPRNREYQLEMERVATSHLRRIGAYIDPPQAALAAEESAFPVEASVVIPVRNRERTVADAVQSALTQQADFSFNVIVVDNHSTDDTSRILGELAAKDPRLVHLIPEQNDLGIGGCWNEAVYSASCGRYAVQLDSDDLYASQDVLQRIVTEFHGSEVAMVIGSYEIVDFDLRQIPPGLIDHREWTDENGPNNALRIAGLGAPRAYHTATLRAFGFPNVSYGEDYAVVLRIAGKHRVGRIYDSLYLCRRWEDNSDHTLPLETVNRYAAYKDRLRSIELAARKNRQP